ncbi:MAG: hypothetical protein CML68_19245 [Rhodobacteraceae bacterium]|nr:hypothetical protein [Paracoccaceae bacterium]
MTAFKDLRIGAFSEKTIRATKLMRTLGLDGLGFSLAIALHDATRPWTARALADYIHHPRTNVLKRLRELDHAGVVTKTEQGWVICPDAQQMICRMLSEFIDLMAGERTGFSPEVVAFCEAATVRIGRPTRRHMDAEAALTISFPKQPRLFSGSVGKAAR